MSNNTTFNAGGKYVESQPGAFDESVPPAPVVEAAGGQALPCIVDIRYEDQVQACIEEAVRAFGGIDILVNNASAIRFQFI